MFPKFQSQNFKFYPRPTKRGFTLVELLISSVLFVVVGGLVTGIALNIKKNAASNEAQRVVDDTVIDIERRLNNSIGSAASISSATSGAITMIPTDSDSEIAYSLSGDSIFYREGSAEAVPITGADVKVDYFDFKIVPSQSVGIDPVNRWAYNDLFGWIDFKSNNSVIIPTIPGDLNGVAWGEGCGDVFLNCIATNNCATSNYKVSVDKNGNLSGYGWSESMGWISFCGNSGGTGGCAPSSVNYGVTINQSTGEFSGQAWSEVAGYISFNCLTGGSDATNVCSSSNYKVQDTRTKAATIVLNLKVSYNVSPYQNVSRSENLTFTINTPSKITITSISPVSGTGIVSGFTVHGTYFKPGATIKLVRSGYQDVYPTTPVAVSSSSLLSGGVFDLTNVASGTWGIQVTNPDGQIGVLPVAFTKN